MARPRSLARSEDFRKVMRRGRRLRAAGIVAYSCRSSSDAPRLGIAVRAANSVDRNRVRRRVKEAFRLAALSQPCDVVVRADERSLDMEFQELVNLLAESLRGCEAPCD